MLGIEFGEKLLWKNKAQPKMDKISSRWEYRIFVGVRVQSGEFWVAMKAGANKARSVRRIPEEERWSKDCVEWVKHVLWHLYKGHPEADGEIPEDKIVEPGMGAVRAVDDMESPLVVVRTRQVPPRAFQIRKEDAEAHGETRGCARCPSWFRGLGQQPHTSECRARFADVIKEDARYQSAEKRKQEFEDRMREKKARHQARKHVAASGKGVVDMGVPREAHPEPLQTEMDLDDQHRGRIRKREEEEETTAMQDADPGGEMTAEVGTTSDAKNVEMVDV